MSADLIVHGVEWTVKELYVYPNEYIYWSIQIVMYPYMTGLVAGAFVLSSLYHVFGQKDLKELAQFSLVFSFALLPVAGLPLLLHLQQPTRALEPLMTPHFTSAIAAFGIVFTTYGLIVFSEIWFVYRRYFVEQLGALAGKPGFWNLLRRIVYGVLTFGARDVSDEAIRVDHKAAKILAGIGIPVACFLHGYAGFIFGSVKANALWMSPLMPVIFIVSAVVSGIALCMLTYIVIMEWRAFRQRHGGGALQAREIKGAETDVITKATRYLVGFLVGAICLELLDLIFRGYTAMKSWDILRSVMYGKDFMNIFVLQYGLGDIVPLILLLLPGRTMKRTVVALVLVLFGVFMMRWNVVIGGQAFSLSFSGYMHYHMPIIPHSIETFKEGLFGALLVAVMPFILFWIINHFVPSLRRDLERS
jgi:Ni/Fe-hydrogenase subunit HybB-like protein